MEKLDRLGWAAGIGFVAYGTRIGIRVSTPDVLERLPAHLPPELKPADSPIVDRLYSLRVGGNRDSRQVRRFNLLYADAGRLARTLDLADVFALLENDIQLYLAESARSRLFVHAGVVGWRGQAIVLPGRSFSGKTTLVAALVRAGATYYSDEYAVFDRHGRVHPYARPLSIRAEKRGPPRRCSAEELGGVAGTRRLPVGLIALSEYLPKKKWRPRSLSPGQGVLALLAHTVPARRRPAAALATLEQAVSGAAVLRGFRGEAEHAAAAILGSLED
jgi:hypothetical protein